MAGGPGETWEGWNLKGNLLRGSILRCFKINSIFVKMKGYDRDSKFCSAD